MTTLSIRQFNGEIPRLPADRLPEGAAQYAKNCDFSHGELRSLKGLGESWTAGVSPVRSLFTDDGLRFFAWDRPCRAYLHPTIDDTAGRVLYQEHGQGVRVALASAMKLSSQNPNEPATSWKAGVKRPTATIGASVTGTATDPKNPIAETVSYVAVAINLWGEESAPSNPVFVEMQHGQTVNLSIAHTPDAGEQALQGIVFYRTYAATQSADFFLLNATPIAGSGGNYTYADSSTATPSTTVLKTAEWDPPPAAAVNLTPMGNGFFVVSSGRDLVFSEPYRPHAWPYRMTLPHGVVGIIAVEGGALVTTQAQSYLITGAHPEQVTQQLLPVEQAGWSDTSLARVGNAAVYAANDGLVDLFGGQPSIESSQQLFTRRDWRDRYGNARQQLRLAAHDGRVLGVVDPAYPVAPGASGGNFLLDLNEGGALSRLDVGQTIYAAMTSPVVDTLYLGTATGVVEFAEGSGSLALEWQSGDYLYPAPVAFAAGIIDCTGSFTVTIYADGVQAHSFAVTTGATPFRLPSVSPAKRWSVKVVGTGSVREISLAQSFQELKQV